MIINPFLDLLFFKVKRLRLIIGFIVIITPFGLFLELELVYVII